MYVIFGEDGHYFRKAYCIPSYCR